jgi:hypothetical protein
MLLITPFIKASALMEKVFIVLALQSVYTSDFGKQHLVDNSYASIPYPVIIGNTQWVLFTFFLQDAPGPHSERRLYLPEYQVKVKYPTMEMVVEEIKDNIYHFRLSGPYDAIGKIRVLERHDVQTWLAAKNEYNQLLSLVLEKEWLLTGGRKAGQKEVAAKMEKDLQVLQEDDLKNYDVKNERSISNWIDSFK